MRNKQRQYGGAQGFTLAELLVILAVIVVLSSLAYPAFLQWRCGVDSGRGARMVYDALREARSRAHSSNYQHMVSFDPEGCRVQVLRGNQAYNTPNSGWDTAHPVQDWLGLGKGLVMRTGSGGDSTATVNVQFNSDGTARLETPAGTSVTPPATVTISLQGGGDPKKNSVVVSNCGRITFQ